MGRIDGTSRNNIRLYFVPLILQIRLHLLEYHSARPINNAENVFTHNPTWLNLSNCSQHLWPEVAVIVRTFSLACKTERLAGESACEHVDVASVNGKVCCLDIFILFCFGKMICKHLATEWVYLAVEHILPAHPLGGQVKAAYARK